MDMDIRCLLVDDFDAVRLSLRSCLKSIGISRIDEATNGATGLEKIEKAFAAGESYNLIFCDWNMPVMSGIDMLRACKANEFFAKIPIIMVTSEANKAAIIEAIKCGASDYIVKPFNAQTVSRKITKVMG